MTSEPCAEKIYVDKAANLNDTSDMIEISKEEAIDLLKLLTRFKRRLEKKIMK